MRTITVEVKNNNGLKLLRDLELKHIIRIVNDPLDSYSLPGDTASIDEFKQWIADAENMPALTLQEAKTKWEQKKKQLEKLTR